MIFKNKPVMLVMGLADTALGLCMMILPRLLPLLVPGYIDSPLFSESMLISLAFPFLVLLVGVGILLKRDWARVMGFFLALIAVISAAAEFMMTRTGPEIVHTGPQVKLMFSVVLPALGIAYFAAHTLLLLLFSGAENPSMGGESPGERDVRRLMNRAEYYCANCTKSVSPEDEICPECGAVLKGLQCPVCKYEDAVSKFKGGNCPRCGAEVKEANKA
jgi:hypothetical protein